MSFRDRFSPDPTPTARTEREDAPEPVRRLLLDLLEEGAASDDEFDPYEVLCAWEELVPTETWGSERRDETRRMLRGLDWPDVYGLIEQVATWDQEDRIERVMAEAGVGFSFSGGEFHLFEPEADELGVTDVRVDPSEFARSGVTVRCPEGAV